MSIDPNQQRPPQKSVEQQGQSTEMTLVNVGGYAGSFLALYVACEGPGITDNLTAGERLALAVIAGTMITVLSFANGIAFAKHHAAKNTEPDSTAP